MKIVNTSGKKKTAIARATLREGKGQIRINKKPLEIMEPRLARLKIMEPIMMAQGHITNIDMVVNVRGGGFMGQAEAVRTAIARGIVEWTGDTVLRDTYAEYDRNLLVNDHRQKERKKVGGPGARAKYQKSYR
ncbi:MAG: 30S ribosomal protein S9 [Euryarchaeota archaeon]|nr:30S ribosomal protein S9 [Euryarchaeota archaeon]